MFEGDKGNRVRNLPQPHLHPNMSDGRVSRKIGQTPKMIGFPVQYLSRCPAEEGGWFFKPNSCPPLSPTNKQVPSKVGHPLLMEGCFAEIPFVTHTIMAHGRHVHPYLYPTLASYTYRKNSQMLTRCLGKETHMAMGQNPVPPVSIPNPH